MSIPEFTAETSLYRSSRHYQQQSTVFAESFGRHIVPAFPDFGSLEPHTFPLPCQPLLNQPLYFLEGCRDDQGNFGQRECYRICDFYYRWRPNPFLGTTCELASSTCGPKSCGYCQAVAAPTF